ncbi:hypothetical protein K456DRAFT_1350195 [Colletotrichum gloeosporioides 23]|nr:hypothetical protein K456DRAFT_1350195 [Colletotrichum gloeosporioides 23]
MAVSIMPSNDELKNLVTEITRDINMSLKQTGSIPEILSSGPWTINYLKSTPPVGILPSYLAKGIEAQEREAIQAHRIR